MTKTVFNISPKIFFTSLSLALLALIILPYLWETFIVIALILFLLGFGKDYLVPIIIFLFLTLSGDINESLRNIINALNVFLLFYLFLKEYGFNFPKYPKIPNTILLLISFVVFSLLMSTLLSTKLYISLNEIGRQIIFFIIVFFLYSFIKDKKEIHLYLSAMLLSSFIIVASILIEFFKTNTMLYALETTGYVTLGGFFNNNASVAGLFVATIPITLMFYFYPELNKRKFKFWILTFLIFQIVGLLLTNSRAAIAGTFIAVLFCLFYLKRSTFNKILLTILIIIPFLFLLPGFELALEHYFRVNRIFENTRYILWDMSFKMFKDNPIWGVGPGMFKYYMYPYLNVPLGSWSEGQIYYLYTHAPLGTVHSFLLMKLSELGIIGFTSGIFLIFLYLRIGFRNIKNAKLYDKEFYIFSIAAVGIGLGLFYRSLFESTGILTNGWITRDLPFWLIFSIMIFIYLKTPDGVKKLNENKY